MLTVASVLPPFLCRPCFAALALPPLLCLDAASGPLSSDASKAKVGDASVLEAGGSLPAGARGDGGGGDGGGEAAGADAEMVGAPRGGGGVPLVRSRKGKIGSHVSDALVFSHGVARELEERGEVRSCCVACGCCAAGSEGRACMPARFKLCGTHGALQALHTRPLLVTAAFAHVPVRTRAPCAPRSLTRSV